eukprot:3152945-Rhodomonas_salina.1
MRTLARLASWWLEELLCCHHVVILSTTLLSPCFLPGLLHVFNPPDSLEAGGQHLANGEELVGGHLE